MISGGKHPELMFFDYVRNELNQSVSRRGECSMMWWGVACGVVWCNVVCGMVWCGVMVWRVVVYGVVWCGVV